jgi:pimeloyl-ACP methyl ester carboxylesterase
MHDDRQFHQDAPSAALRRNVAMGELMKIRTTLQFALAAIGLLAGNFTYGANMSNQGTSVVIVHGAFTNGSDWTKVIELLQAKGIEVRAVHNGLNSLAEDVAATRRTIDGQSGRVVLVGHSWGGMVITEAGLNDKVAALVYVAAFVPGAGQSLSDLGKDYPPSPGNTQLKADADGYLSLPPEAIASDFAQDLPAQVTSVLVAMQGPIQSKALGEKTTVAAWSSKPSWYIVSEKDRMIQPDMERAMARTIGARVTSLPTSHVAQLSRPDAVAKVIIEAVEASGR